MFNAFLKPTVKVVKKIDRMGDVVNALQALSKQDVLIGLPEAANSRKGDTLTNAELAFIHSKGSPINNIPPRPFLEPSIEANADKLAILQGRVIRSALDGKATITGLNMIGLLGQNAAKGWFTDPANNWPPNAPATIAAKGSDKPLIDTGQLRNAITYVVRNKNAHA